MMRELKLLFLVEKNVFFIGIFYSIVIYESICIEISVD